jgi:exosortase
MERKASVVPSTNNPLTTTRPRSTGGDGAGRYPLLAVVTYAAVLLAYSPQFLHAVDVWGSDAEFGFAFLMPPLSALLLWLRRRRIRLEVRRGDQLGLIPFAGGLLVYLLAARLGIHALGGLSFAATVLGVVVYLHGAAAARVVAFPIGFLTVGLALYRGLLDTVGFTLQHLTAQAAAAGAAALGIPVQRSGVDLFVGGLHFVVAEACSGLSSLVALLCLGGLVIGVVNTTPPRRVLMMMLVLPIVFVANTARVTLVLFLARSFGLAVAQGFIHGLFSAVLFLGALSLFLFAVVMLQCVPRSIAMA